MRHAFLILLGLKSIFLLKTRSFTENKVIFVEISVTVRGSNYKVLKTDGQFRFLSPGTYSKYLMHDALSQGLTMFKV
jgi:hypothetical protein